MSEWGKVIFYYDYERAGYRGYTENIKGLISKAYPWPGVLGLVLHAYYGTRYFLERCDKESVNFNQSFSRHCADDRAALNEAFDVFFDQGMIKAGLDAVMMTMEEWDFSQTEGYDGEREDENYFNLFGGDESYGVIYIRYTGNIKDGYSLKYRYMLDGEDVDDLTEAIKKDLIYEGADENELSGAEFECVAYLNDHSDPVAPDEVLNVEGSGYELIKELMKSTH